MSYSKKHRPPAVIEAIERAGKHHLSIDPAPLIKHIEFLESELDRAAEIASLRADTVMSLSRQIIKMREGSKDK